MINWKKYFDHIYCIHYLPHVERYKELNDELNRVSILNSGIFEYLYTKEDNTEYRVKAFKVTLNHKKCLEDAINNSYNRILILENDVKFLKDLSLLEQYLENIPEDADLILFDYIFGYEHDEISRLFEFKKYNKNKFINIGLTNRIFSAACYMCSPKMQIHLINNYNSYQPVPDFFTTYSIKSVDNEEDEKLKRYVPDKNLAIQKVFENNLRSTLYIGRPDITYDRYTFQGIKLEDYNI